MKSLLLLSSLFFTLLGQGAIYQVESCRTRLLRSYGFSGQAVPNDSNALCPSVTRNCCTPIDQMAMHKLWNKHSKPHLEKVYKGNIDAFNTLEAIIEQKDTVLLAKATEYFRARTDAHTGLKSGLDELQKRFDALKRESLVKDFGELKTKETLKNLYAASRGLRQGLLCALCDARNGSFLSAESNQIIYSNSFCSTLVKDYSVQLGNQWANIVAYLLLLDHYAIIASGKGLFPPEALHSIRSAQSAARQCVKSSCSDFCSEFSVNRLSVLFDGFGDHIRAWVTNYKLVFGRMSNPDDSAFASLFAFRLEESDPMKIEAAKKLDPDFQVVDKEFWTTVKRQSLARSRDTISVSDYILSARVTAMKNVTASDLEENVYNLFSIASPPIQMSDMEVRYSDTGLNLFNDSAELNFDLTVDQLLKMFVVTDVSITIAEEPIHQIVKDIVLNTPVAEIKGFLGDLFLDYDKFIDPELLVKAEMSAKALGPA